MKYVLVPRYVSAREGSPTSAGGEQVWIGAFGDSRSDDPSRREVELIIANERVRISGWTQVLPEQPVWYATSRVSLAKGDHEIKLLVDSNLAGSAHVSPLPRELGAETFRVLLGSCFDPGLSGSNRLKKMADDLSGPAPLKILCGDQAYLDPTFPACLWSSFRSPDASAAAIYRRTWTHPGFAGLLARGLNVFCPDDHDFWNDYTVERGAREPQRAHAAVAMLDAFQCDQPLQTFDVPPLRFMIADTRRRRTEPSNQHAQFVDEDVLERMIAWVGRDAGPGVLVLGQPMFGEDGYDHGYYGSDLIQYTRQFGRLAEALINAPCSMVILSGDLHWGRIAHGTNLKGKALIEVISSPLAMSSVRSAAGYVRPWRTARPLFGPGDVRIETEMKYKVTAPHFAIIDFSLSSERRGQVDMKVKAWPVRKPLLGSADSPTFACTI